MSLNNSHDKMEPLNSTDHRAKRRKIDVEERGSVSRHEGAYFASSSELRELLAFQQNATADTKVSLSRFRDFLASIQHGSGGSEAVIKNLRILKEYCHSQMKMMTRPDGSEMACFPDMIEVWSFAESSNNESLLVAVPSTLAMFLKTISNQIEFRDFGLALCKYLLQKEQLRLFSRNLGYNKSKEHLISPCIRLLTEIVSFDGGAVSRLVHLTRDVTFSRLDVFLTPNKNQRAVEYDENRATKSRASLRRNAQIYFLANLRFQGALPKGDFIEQHKVVRSFLEPIRHDSQDIVIEALRTIDKHIAQDKYLSRSSKTKFFNRWNLERLVTLYGYSHDSDGPESDHVSVRQELHTLLIRVCTDPEIGILLPSGGWYPTGSDPDTLLTRGDEGIELGLDSPAYVDKYKEQIPIRNGTLSFLIQEFRPESDALQIELLLRIFEAAPELVADYFSKREMFASDPKPTSSWLGESALLFSAVQLPIPGNCGWRNKMAAMPPPASVAIESILPRPLTQKILTRCLNMNSEVVTIFAVRLLSTSLRKLQSVLDIFATQNGPGQQFWNQATNKLIAEFCHRCPLIKDVLTLFKRTPRDDLEQLDAVTELLLLYYEVIPSAAFEEPLDVTLPIFEALKDLEEPEISDEKSRLLMSQLQSFLALAQKSTTLKWWQKPASLRYSAFSSILRTLVESRYKDQFLQIRNLLGNVLIENSILTNNEASFDGLFDSFKPSTEEDLPHQLEFLDNCLCRLAKQPVHYLDLLDSLIKSEDGHLSLLVVAIEEQWAYLTKTKKASREKLVGSWIAQLLRCLNQAGEDKQGLKLIRDRISQNSTSSPVKLQLKKAFKDLPRARLFRESEGRIAEEQQQRNQVTESPGLLEIFGNFPIESKSHSALYRWENEDLDAAIEQGRVKALILCLCSEHEEIRRQASAAISRLMAKLKESNNLEWRSVYILLGELWETANLKGFQIPMPYIAGELAASCLTVLTDPLHKMYGKINLFLQKHPSWEIDKIPSYWIDKIILHEPEYDDGYGEELNWLLDLLIQGLRTVPDLEIYRKVSVFERLLALYTSPACSAFLKKKILHIIFRATQVGASSTLTTRAGMISWFQGQVGESGLYRDIISQLTREVYVSGDQERVDQWSGGILKQLVDKVAT